MNGIKKEYQRTKVILIVIFIILSLSGCQVNNVNKKDEIIESTPKEYDFVFNPHVISKEFSLIYGEEIENIFFSFCDTLLAKEKQFKCESSERLYQLLSISNTCFPLANEIIDRDKTYVENSICYITYKYNDDELDRIINKFKEKVSSVISGAIRYETSDYIKAMELYSAVAKKNKYDYDYTLDDSLNIRSFRSIMEDIGICQEISGEYIYYLLQIGINGITCSALNKDKSEAHEWVLINLNDKYYHVDPTYALNYPESLFFFAIDDKQREYYGDFNKNDFIYADSDILKHDKFKSDDRKFLKFWLAKSYSIDYKKKTITIIDNNTSEKHEYKFDE